MTDSLIERGAIALLENDGFSNWATQHDHVRKVYLRRSRAYLEDIIEPTERMKTVGNQAWNDEKPADYIFRAMIAIELETDT